MRSYSQRVRRAYLVAVGAAIGQLDHSAQRRDCVAEVVGLELRNVVAKYLFERSHRFPGIRPNSGHRDYSRLSCGVAETQLGASARISAGMLVRALVNR